MMRLPDLLGVAPGITALIGGGGKTSLMDALAEELKASGPVVLCTSTRIWRPEQFPVFSGAEEAALIDGLERYPVICAGADAGGGKLMAPECPFARLAALAPYVLVEADGSKGLPMKAHAPGEPVIPDGAGQVILVIGASGFGRPIREAAHRPALYAALAGAGEEDILTPRHAARVALAEGLHHRVFLNQVESDEARGAADTLRGLLPGPLCAGSLHKMEFIVFP